MRTEPFIDAWIAAARTMLAALEEMPYLPPLDRDPVAFSLDPEWVLEHGPDAEEGTFWLTELMRAAPLDFSTRFVGLHYMAAWVRATGELEDEQAFTEALHINDEVLAELDART